jgi:ABC-type thiamine transport system substrate-binding protein
MYYDSEIKNYFELLNDIEDVISSWWSTITLEWTTYDISQFNEMYEAMYKKTPSKTFSDMLKSLISDKIISKYESLKSEYLEMLKSQ